MKTLTKDERVKNEIIQQAQKLFDRFGPKKTTMDEIAAAAGKAKSTLYHYFSSKDDVFREVIDREMNSIRSLVHAEVEKADSLQAQMRVYLLTYYKSLMNNVNLHRIIKNSDTRKVSKSDYYMKALNYEIHYITELMIKGARKGELTSIDEKEIPWLAETLIVGFGGIVMYSIDKEGAFNDEQINKIEDLLINRIIT